MIRITYREAKENVLKLRAEGHAGYAPKGQDIVCAAVSTLMQALAFSVNDREDGFAVASSSGAAETYLELQARATPENRAKFELVTDGLELVAQLYPKFVTFDDGAGTEDMVDLQLFADGGDGGTAGDGAESAPAVQAPELRPAQERLAKRSHPGKSAKAGAPAPASDSGADTGSEAAKEDAPGKEKPETQQEKQEPEHKPADPAEKRRAFGQLMQSEYAAEFEEAMQRAAQLAVQNVQQSPDVKGLLEALGEAYGIDAQDANNLAALTDAIKNGKVKNDEYYETMAAERGISVKTAREMDRMESELQRANAEKQRTEQLRVAMEHQQRAAAVRAQWEAEAAQLKVKYPEFELDEVLNNPSVADMIRRGIGLEAAYRAAYFDKLMEASTARTAQQVEQGVAARIQQRAQRPAENGAHPGGAAEMKVDVAHMTAKQRAELAKRARRGERIVL
nr:MAG TPA: YsxB-like protein [Caudoviricetes sp.]